MGNLTTTREILLDYYAEFSDYNVFSKQNDSNRFVKFAFMEDVIPPASQRDKTFRVFVRGHYASGAATPIAEIVNGVNGNQINDDNIVFHIPKYLLYEPGTVTCDLVMARVPSGTVLTVNADGSVNNVDNIEVLSTHTFNIYSAPMGNQCRVTPAFQGYMDAQLQYILTIEQLDKQLTANEEVRCSNEDVRNDNEDLRNESEAIRQGNESVRVSNESTRLNNENVRNSNESTRRSNEAARIDGEAQRQSNEDLRDSNEQVRAQNEGVRNDNELIRIANENTRNSNEDTRNDNEEIRIQNELLREDKERGYVRQAEQWAEVAASAIDTRGYIRLQIEGDGCLYMYKAGDCGSLSFQISEDHKSLEAVFSNV